MNNKPPSAGDELVPLYRAVFDEPGNGTPDNITQAGCVALARLGKEAWNAWRKDNPVSGSILDQWKNTADFSGFDFREESIDFQSFVFDHGARFDRAKFADDLSFDDAQFGYNARFTGAQFGDDACFRGAQLGDNPSFTGAQFGKGASFSGAQLSDNPSFTGAQFGKGASFSGAKFADDLSFDDAQFRDYASFDGAQFGDSASFGGAQFGDHASFDGAQFGEFAYFVSAQFGHTVSFAALTWAALTNRYCKHLKVYAKSQGLSPEAFKSIFFEGVEFAGQVNFSGRAFEGPTSFGRLTYPRKVRRRNTDGNVVEKDLPEGKPVVFGQAPLFHNCKLHQDTTFDGAKFPKPSTDPTKNDTAARAYRTLKLAFAQQQATREEQRFFRLEMAEEAARTANSQRWLFVVYKCVSDYGFSLSRPTLWWLGFMLLFLLIYSLLADLTQCFPWQADCYIRYDVLQFTLLQALPLPGLDKWSFELWDNLFPKAVWQSAVLTLAVMFQKAISLLAIFLFGLALRNLFKMK